MDQAIKKILENQGKIVDKIKAMDIEIKALASITNSYPGSRNDAVAIQNRIGGIETILVSLGVTQGALELHQSFDDQSMRDRNLKKKEWINS